MQFTEDQLLIRNMVREFAENEVKPIAAEIDREHRFPAETVKRMAELGLFGLGRAGRIRRLRGRYPVLYSGC